MDFGFTEEQEQLRESVRDYLAGETPASYARAMCDDPRGFTDRVWKGISALGWLGLTVPERYGGVGLGVLELASVAEAMGEVIFPGPFFSTACLGVPALLATGSEEQLDELLPPIAAGERRVTLAVAETAGRWTADGVACTAVADGSGYVLDGAKLFVPDARTADLVVVLARLGDGLGWFAVPTGTDGFAVEAMQTVDLTRKLDVVRLDGLRVDRETLLGGQRTDAGVLDDVVDVGKIALSAEMCGAAERALAMCVEYTQIREQFGRAIATFQALQHRIADMKVSVEEAKSLVYYAAWTADENAEDRRRAAAMAKAFASDACPGVVADAVQVHGGIGFTWEHDLHLYFKRVKADEATFGDAADNRAVVADLLGLTA